MAENIPNPTPGAPAVPPKKAETGKVQPKKETVRISLPPKPTAAPTIKLPTLPAGGPPPATAAPTAAAAHPASRAPAPPAPPSTPAALRAAPPGAAPGARPAAAAAAPAAPAPARPPSAPAAKPGITGLDLGLGIAAMVMAIGAVVSIFLLLQMN
jgi:hypothetical protein